MFGWKVGGIGQALHSNLFFRSSTTFFSTMASENNSPSTTARPVVQSSVQSNSKPINVKLVLLGKMGVCVAMEPVVNRAHGVFYSFV